MTLYSKLSVLLFSVCMFCCIFINNAALASKTDNAVSVVNELLDEVSNIQKTEISIEQRRADFLKLIYAYFDINIIAKASTGPYWRAATSDEKDHYTKLISELIADVTSSQLGDIDNFSFDFQSSIPKGDKMVMVSGNLLVPNQSIPKISVKWRVSTPDSDIAKIIDVEFENISMLVTQKQENVAIIRKNAGSFPALIEAIEGKLRK
ncbi:MAG: ABC transporter substrate-binding protein [Alphaproteobacteria bacterium]|nr:ABC transporter substrate-binding protein [Alphaproteobacteria bacterium]